jgi:hypothetical protein
MQKETPASCSLGGCGCSSSALGCGAAAIFLLLLRPRFPRNQTPHSTGAHTRTRQETDRFLPGTKGSKLTDAPLFLHSKKSERGPRTLLHGEGRRIDHLIRRGRLGRERERKGMDCSSELQTGLLASATTRSREE